MQVLDNRHTPPNAGAEREIATIKLRSAALNQEAMILTGLIGKENDHCFALEKARGTRELLNAVERSGLAITDQLRTKIDQLAGAYAASVANVDAARAAQETFTDKQAEAAAKIEDFKSGAKDVLTGFIGDLRAGVSETEALSNALANVADQLLELSLNALFKSPAAEGIVEAIIGGLGFSNGGFTGHGDRKSVAGVVHGQEFVVNARATAENRALLETINAGAKLPVFTVKTAPIGESNVVALAPTINISVGSASRGDKADAELAANIGKVINTSLRQFVADELRRQMRPRGMLNLQ